MPTTEVDTLIRAERVGDRARVVSTGCVDLPHVTSVVRALQDADAVLHGCRSLEVDVSGIDRIDGTGAVLPARFLDRVEAGGISTRLVTGRNAETARLVALYRQRRANLPAISTRRTPVLARLGSVAARAPDVLATALDFTGRATAAVPGMIATTALTGMSARAYAQATADASTAEHFISGLA